MEEPTVEIGMRNGNTGTNTPIEITTITEENQTGIPYLILEPTHELPYSLSAGEDFFINVSVNPNAIRHEPAYTTVRVHSSQNSLVFGIYIDESLLSVTKLSEEAKLYPNPTTGQFTVEGANVAKVEVYNLVGQKVHEAVASSLAMTDQVVNIDATDWHKGIYLVNIIEENGAVVTKKLVVR
jgi:hypothetical protein